jgi:nucleoside-diphosphate-sugar epimerase
MSDVADGKFSGKRLVIFGCGYVGGELARQAVARGLHVTALTRNAEKAAALRAMGADAVVADLATDEWHGRIRGAEFVVNCVSSGGAGLPGYHRSYVEGMDSILRWVRGTGSSPTLIYTSSTSVYPQGDGACVNETAPTDDAPERGQILLEAEARLRAGMAGQGRWFILRLAGIYGPGRHALLDQVIAGEMAGREELRLNLIHRDDICRGIWCVLGAPPEVSAEIFNLADDGAARRVEIATWLAGQLGRPVPAFSGESAPGRRPSAPDRVIDNRKIKRMLGWSPSFPTFREGYAKILSLS